MALLEIKNLKKYFANQKAVDDISFNIESGQIFGLLGPNGAGKTTLIRMITGIFYPDEGEILFDGKTFNPEKDSARIGYMPEERGLYKKMKIGEQAMYLAQLKGMGKAEASKQLHQWFEKFDMESWWNKKVEDLSKGMGQKLQFVITVVHNPKLLILDEPFSGLDPVNANLIKDEIFNLSKAGSTIIFSTHRMEQVEEICNQIVLVNKGKKILDGTVNSVKQQYKEHVFRIEFAQAVVAEAMATHLFEVIRSDAKTIYIRLSPSVTINEVLSYFIGKGISLESFQEELLSLNEIFIKLVEGKAATSFSV